MTISIEKVYSELLAISSNFSESLAWGSTFLVNGKTLDVTYFLTKTYKLSQDLRVHVFWRLFDESEGPIHLVKDIADRHIDAVSHGDIFAGETLAFSSILEKMKDNKKDLGNFHTLKWILSSLDHDALTVAYLYEYLMNELALDVKAYALGALGLYKSKEKEIEFNRHSWLGSKGLILEKFAENSEALSSGEQK